MDEQGKKGFYSRGAEMKAMMGKMGAQKLAKSKAASERNRPVAKGAKPMKGMKSMKKGML